MAESTGLCLHVGYGKTGSTYLQAWLASQASQLAATQIQYPIPQEGLGDSGNGHLLLEALQNPASHYAWLPQPPKGALLFSREHLARELSANGACDQLAAWAQRWQLGPVRVLLLVRDPQEHCYSLWAQKVKRAGEKRSLMEFAESYDAITMVNCFLAAASASGFEIRVLDYGRHRRQLVASFCKWLGSMSLTRPDQAMPTLVNLTPSHGQLRLQRRMHKFWHGGLAPVPPTWLSQYFEPRNGILGFSSEQLSRWSEQVMAFNALCDQFSVHSDGMPCGKGILQNRGGIELS